MCVQVGWIQRIQCRGVNAVNPFMNLLEVFKVQIERLEWIQSVKSNAPTVASAGVNAEVIAFRVGVDLNLTGHNDL